MSQLGAILRAKGRILRHAVAGVRRHSRLKVGFVSLAAALLWGGIFAAARFGFGLLEDFGADLVGPGLRLSDLLMSRLLAVFALALLVMLGLSNVLVAFSTLYRSREMAFLLTRPVPTATLFLGRFYECVTFSSWASAYLGSPVLIAYGLETSAPPLYYLALVAFYLPFVTLPAALGTLATVALVPRLPAVGRRGWLALGALAVVAVFLLFRGELRAPDLADPAAFRAVIEAMGRAQHPLLPSFWLARGLLDAASGDTGRALYHLLLLVANALFASWLAVVAAERWLVAGWDALASRSARARAVGRGILGRLETLLRVLPEPTRVLFAKDLRLFWRDPAQWSQFVLFFGMMALYVANLGSSDLAGRGGVWRGWITLLNLTACLLILATLTTRFIYPLLSLEGRRFWILGLAPLPRRRLVHQKLWLSVGTSSVFTIGIAVLSAWKLQLRGVELALSLATIAAATFALSGLAVGLGSLYPNFREDNPARIVSGMGGTLNFLLSMVYVVLVSAALAVVLQWPYVEPFVGGGTSGWVAAGATAWIALWSAAAGGVPLWLGVRNLERVEI